MNVGIVTNELFDPRAGRVGGFGWAARAAARCLAGRGMSPLFLSTEIGAHAAEVLDAPIVLQRSHRVDLARRLRAARIDVLLTIDYRPNYTPILAALPRTPTVLWVRDPRGPREHAALSTLRVPGTTEPPAGVDPLDCTSLARVARGARLVRRPLVFASPAPETLTPRAPGAFGFDPGPLRLLPNPVADGPTPPAPSPGERPSLVFLGRLDPVKRPWLFAEVARRVPDADFLMLGGTYVEGPGSWRPRDLPPNLRLLGHVGGEEKERLVASAAACVNTSIHEALPVSFLESLWCGTPVVAGHDPERTVSRFGAYVGRFDGDGLAGAQAFAAAVRALLAGPAGARRLGQEGRAWVESTHSADRFAAAFAALAGRTAEAAA